MVEVKTGGVCATCSYVQQMEYALCDQENVHGAPIQVVHKGQRRYAAVCWVNTGVANNSSYTVLYYTTGSPDFLPSTQERYAKFRNVRHG